MRQSLNSSLRKSLNNLHSDEQAQVSFLAVAAALCFVALLAMVMNSNDLIRERVRMQEVADVTALSAATWSARGMNLVSMINVLNSKLLSMTVLVNSLNKTLPIVEKIAVVQGAAFKACSAAPFVGIFCAAMAVVVQIQEKIIKVMGEVIENIAKFTECDKLVWKVMEGLQSAAEGVRKSFPAIATASAVQIANENGASFGIAINGGAITGGSPATQALYLPVTSEGYTTANFCNAMTSGGPGYVMEGYSNDQGPVRLGKSIWDIVFIPFFNLLPHPIFYGFYSYYMAQIGCTPDAMSEEYNAETDFYDLPACRKYGATAEWERFYSTTDWVDNGSWTTDDFVAWESLNGGQGSGLSQSENEKFGELGEYGQGLPDPIPSPPPNYGPGYQALQGESNLASANASCVAGNSASGYPLVGTSLFGSGCLGNPASCESLRTHPSYTLYSGTTHTRNPAGLDSERTGVYYLRVERESEVQTNSQGDPVTRYRYSTDVWALSSAGSAQLEGDELNEYVESQGGGNSEPGDGNDGSNSKDCKNKIQPLLLDQNQNPQNRMRYIAMVYVELGSGTHPLPFWSNFFDTPPDRMTAYAQAQVYNKLSEDMFTQDWRVRLEQANLLEAALGNSNGFSLEGTSGIGSQFIESVNNH